MRWGLVVVAFALLPACTETKPYVQPSYATSTYDRAPPAVSSTAAKIPVSIDRSIGRDCEIIAVFDIHTHADSQDKGFDELRARAAELGADAVIGAEFEHGDGDEPSHLSGLAVRYTRPRPESYSIGQIDVPSNEDDTDKGLDKMRALAQQMGADQVVNVQFEHGEDGKLGHLTGTAVKYRR